MEFVPHEAPLVVLGFLALGPILAVAALFFLRALILGRRVGALRILGAMAGVAGIYAGMLLAFSLGSSEKVLAADETKYFCEIDCHLAYSVQSVATAKTLGSGANQLAAQGTFYIVTLKTWFDERTISTRRAKDMPLWPNPRAVRIVDEQGRQFSTSLEGQRALDIPGSVPLEQPLRPGESYTTALVFDLPADAARPRLLVTARDPVTLLLIGHENSPLHKKVLFGLGHD